MSARFVRQVLLVNGLHQVCDECKETALCFLKCVLALDSSLAKLAHINGLLDVFMSHVSPDNTSKSKSSLTLTALSVVARLLENEMCCKYARETGYASTLRGVYAFAESLKGGVADGGRCVCVCVCVRVCL